MCSHSLPHNCGISNLPSVPSVVQISKSLTAGSEWMFHSLYWNDCNNFCPWHMVYGVALLCYRATSYNRCPYTFLHIALHNCHSGHLRWLLMSSLGGYCCVPECGCHNISRKLTLWIFWLMEKLSVFTAHVLLLVTMDFRNSVPSSLTHFRCEKSILRVLILVLFCQTS